jgi:hypothetical protein
LTSSLLDWWDSNTITSDTSQHQQTPTSSCDLIVPGP